MKQYQIDAKFGIDALKCVETSIPTPGADEVLIKVAAVSLNFRDYNIVRGGYPETLSFPFTPVSDGAGEIAAVGSMVVDFKPGDRVMTHFLPDWRSGTPTIATLSRTLGAPLPGLLAEYVVLPSQALSRIPDYLTFQEAATLPVAALTAWQAIVTGGINASQTIAVQGTGGVALFAVQFAKLHGAKVIITSSSDQKIQRALDLGADMGVNYKTLPDWSQEILKLTNTKGVDFILDVVGTTINASLAATKVGGHVSAIGLLNGHTPEINIVPLLQHKKSIVGITVGSYDMLQDMLAAMQAHDIHPVIGATFAFHRAKSAFSALAKGGTFGKIVISVDSSFARD